MTKDPKERWRVPRIEERIKMAKKTKVIQTNLLGQRIKIVKDLQIWGVEKLHEVAGKSGVIRNVYYDQEGDLKYTIQIFDTGQLVELYSHAFLI